MSMKTEASVSIDKIKNSFFVMRFSFEFVILLTIIVCVSISVKKKEFKTCNNGENKRILQVSIILTRNFLKLVIKIIKLN